MILFRRLSLGRGGAGKPTSPSVVAPRRGCWRSWLTGLAEPAAANRRRWCGLARSAWCSNEADLDLERAIQGLPKRQRLAVELHYFAGLTTAETASVMSCTEGTVKSALYDARSNLRRALEQP